MSFADQPIGTTSQPENISTKTNDAEKCLGEHKLKSLRDMLALLQEEEESAKSFVDLIESEAVGIDGTMQASLLAVDTYAEILRDCYKDVVEHFPPEIREAIMGLIEILYNKSRQTRYLINNFLLQLQCVVHGEVNKEIFQHYSITQNIEKTLAEYPFKAQERKLIQFKKERDFIYYGDMRCTNHVLFSLIKNALFSIGNLKKGKITIKLVQDGAFNQLIFRCNAYYAMEEKLPLLRNYFELCDEQAMTNLCLAFIKVVMQSYGGSVIYSATKKTGIELILNFPRIKKRNK